MSDSAFDPVRGSLRVLPQDNPEAPVPSAYDPSVRALRVSYVDRTPGDYASAYDPDTGTLHLHTVKITAVSLTSTPSPTLYSVAVSFTATVSAVSPATGTPTGTVTFKDGASVLATEALVSGAASYSTTGLAVGIHSVTAAYGGDGTYDASSSTVRTQTVNHLVSATTLTSDVNPSDGGDTVVFTATAGPVSPSTGAPTGTVTFKDGVTVLATTALTSGSATYSTSGLSGGDHTIKAVYGGDAGFTGSTSVGYTQTVNVVTRLQDSFTDDDSTDLTAHTMDVGPGWTQGTTLVVVNGNAALCPSGQCHEISDSGASNVTISANVTISGVASGAGLLARYINDSNWLLLWYGAGNPGVILFECTAGSVNQVGESDLTITEDTAHAIKLWCSGDGVFVAVDGSGTLITFTTSQGISETKHGICLQNGAVLDDFLVVG